MASKANASVEESKGLFNFIPVAVAVVAIIVAIFFCALAVPMFIDAANNGMFNGGGSGGGGGGGGGDEWDWIRLFIQLFHK